MIFSTPKLPLASAFILAAVLTGCGSDSSSNSSDNSPDLSQSLEFNLNNTSYAAVRFDDGDWQQLQPEQAIRFAATNQQAAIISSCNNTLLVQQRTVTQWRADNQIHSGCVDHSTINPLPVKQVTFSSPPGSILIDMAVSNGSSSQSDDTDNEMTFSLSGFRANFSAVYEEAGRFYYLHQTDFDISDSDRFELPVTEASEIQMLSDALSNDQDPGHGYMPYYIENNVRLLMTPDTDAQRYGLTTELTENGYFEHNWNSADNTQLRTIEADGFDVDFPGLATANDLLGSFNLSQDGKTLELAIPQLDGAWALQNIHFNARFGDNNTNELRIEIDPQTCADGRCITRIESPMQLPGFNASEQAAIATFEHQEGNSTLKWRAQFTQDNDFISDTLIVSDQSLF